MSPHDNPEDPHCDEGEVISVRSRWSFSRRTWIILIVLSIIAVSALTATVAVTVDRQVNGGATFESNYVDSVDGVSSDFEAVEDGADLLSFDGERDLATCPVSGRTRVICATSSSFAKTSCRREMLRFGCVSSRCTFFATTPVYNSRTRCWSMSCGCK